MLRIFRLIGLTLAASMWGALTISYGNHILGGEISMKPAAGVNNFEITLIQFWNEKNLIAATPTMGGNRDEKVQLFIYRKSNNEYLDYVLLDYQSTSSVTYENKACATVRSLMTLQGIYKNTMVFPPSIYSDPEGYYMVLERCCRNEDINNVKDAGATGMVFYLQFPATTLANSSPVFAFPNGQYVCVNRPFKMNSSAVDPDGDELRYSLVTPYRGNTTPTNPSGNSSKKNGYPLLTWANGISEDNIIPGPAPLSVDPKTGILSVTASQLGLYLFTVQCDEYRNGVKIGEARRDFQLLVIDCNTNKPEIPVITVRSGPVNDVKICPDQSVQLETSDSPEWAFQWQLNGLNVAGATTNQLMVTDTGSYTVVKSYVDKCARDTTSTPVHVGQAAPISTRISVDKRVLCENDEAILIANDGTPIPKDYTYVWSRDAVTIAENAVQASVRQPGIYKLFVKDTASGCTGQDTVSISEELVTVSIPKNVTVEAGSDISVTASITPLFTVFSAVWFPVDQGFKSDPTWTTALLGPSRDATYTIRVTSNHGCVSEDSVHVTVTIPVVERIYIPTAFSPNQDGKNDTFEIFNAKGKVEEVKIYNRWGQVVFHSNGYDIPWNGKLNNQDVPPGVYPYRIRTVHGDLQGEVLLLK